MVAVAWKHPNVYIDTSAYVPRAYPAELIQFLKSAGRKKVMFGTNFPQLSYEQCTKDIPNLNLKGSAYKNFARNNALEVFNIKQPGKTP